MFDVDYIRPDNLEETLDFLNTKGAESKILAGGTDIMIDLRSGTLNTRYLIDVSRLDELKKIEICDGKLCIGAAVTIAELLESEITHFAVKNQQPVTLQQFLALKSLDDCGRFIHEELPVRFAAGPQQSSE